MIWEDSDLLHRLSFPFYRKQSVIQLTETQEKVPQALMEDSPSADELGSRAGAEWAPLRQRLGLFNSHSSRIWLNAVTISIYSVMLLGQ